MEASSLEDFKMLVKMETSGLVYQRELDVMCEERERFLCNQRLDMESHLRYGGQTEEEFRE